MKKLAGVIIGLVLIFIIISSEATIPLSNIVKAGPLPPRTETDLKSVSDWLMATTSLADRFDTDGDGFYDKVEVVIGTDFDNIDSDFDKLTDFYEVQNGLDPLNADSNNDGLPDYYEVTDVVADFDNDGVTNVWDFDNDADQVNDAVDLSPFAKSQLADSFQFNISTNGQTTYVTFQVRPEKSDYLKILNKYWNWIADDKGTMKDLDNSDEDLYVLPMLNITANVIPDQSDVIEYGIINSNGSSYVPLYAVEEYGTTVAFTGRMIYPQGAPLNLSMKVEMIWKVIGKTDEKATALKASNGRYLSVDSEGIVTFSSSSIGGMERLLLVDLGQGTVAFKGENGRYLSVADDGSVFANATEIGRRERFEWTSSLSAAILGQQLLKAYNGRYLEVKTDGTLSATSTYWVAKGFSTVAAGILTESITLMNYKEPFFLTGLTAEENYESKIGLFFSHNRNETIAANLFLSYEFLRNSTSNLLDTPLLLGNQEIEMFNLLGTFSHKDEAFMSLTNTIMPDVLSMLQAGGGSLVLPVITAFEDDFVSLDLSEMVPGGTSFWSVDLAAEPVVTSKTLRMALYNTTDLQSLEPADVISEVMTWETDEEAQVRLISLMVAWNIGEQLITKVGADLTRFQTDPQLTAITKNIKLYGITALKVATLVYIHGARVVNSIITVTMETGVSLWTACWRSVQSVSLSQSANMMAFRRISLTLTAIAGLLDLGVALYSLFTILDANLNPLQLYASLMHTVMTLAYSLTLGMIGAIPVIGWIFSAILAISDAIGGWSTKLFDAIIDAMCSVTAQVTPNIRMVRDPQIDIIDKDGDGIDVGDRIEFSARINATLTSGDRKILAYSEIYPYYEIVNPPGTNSTVGYPYLTEWVFMAKDLGGSGNDIHLWLPIPPAANRVYSGGEGWRSNEYDVGGWIEPGTAMVNFPVALQSKTQYELWYKYEIFYFFVFYWFTEEYLGRNAGIQTLGTETLYFDVMPASLSDFLNWKGVTPLDRDFDGLINTAEIVSNPTFWDTDSDGLNDKYELDIGTSPILFDTDGDGLNDRVEQVYFTNGTDVDTDGDGLSDYSEVAGWISVFYFGGEVFALRVASNPLIADTDGDGLTDDLECSSRLNPKSKDTNGDGVIDVVGEPLPIPDWLLDTEGDGLNDAVEKMGWSIIVSNSVGNFTVSVNSDPYVKDTDFDGLTDFEEYNLNTNPRVPDTDEDGITDFDERQLGTSPILFDTDGDGLSDGVELSFGSDPKKSDTDGEGLSDFQEFLFGSDPTSNDTDSDGLDDFLEIQFGSDINLPDTDGDSLFDGEEVKLGTSPINIDSDGDNLTDGFEVIISTNPVSNDTDSDQVSDYQELELGISPLMNDTDLDGLLDGLELTLSTAPWNNDTDYDGLSDLEDPDSYIANVQKIVVVYDGDSETLRFIENLRLYTDVDAISVEEFLANYTSYPYIVLIGKPSSDIGTVGNIAGSLFQNYGEHMSNQTFDNSLAVRYDVWGSNQTVVAISGNYYANHYRVLSVLRRQNVTIEQDAVIVKYNGFIIPNGTSQDIPLVITDEMDMVRATDSVVSVSLAQPASPTIQVTKFNASTTPHSLVVQNGLSVYDNATGKYFDVEISDDVQNVTSGIISSAVVRFYYTTADLDRTGDGDADDPEDFDENTLSLYYYMADSDLWIKVSLSLEGVRSFGVNSTDLTIYGKNYAGFVWADVSSVSLFGLAGQPLSNQSPIVSNALVNDGPKYFAAEIGWVEAK